MARDTRGIATPLRVLILEDRPADAELMVHELRRAGFAPDWRRVATEQEYREQLESGPDVVLADYTLPQYDALRALHLLQELRLDVPFIVVTATVGEEAAVECMKQGAADYLLKDRLSRLGMAVQRALEQKQLRDEKRRAEEARIRLLEERAARGEAEAAIRARDEFLALVSHDLKSPLAAIKGQAQLLQRHAAQVGAKGLERLADGLGKIDLTATKMVGLIDELLDVARLQMGEPLALQRRPTDLVALARQVVAEHQQTAERHQIQVEAPERELVGQWDATRLERVLDNLLDNAIKYSPDGGQVVVYLADKAGWAVVQVRDHGLGIPAADLPRIFERFHRGANVAGVIRGTGIGLAGARQIVEQHGGWIVVRSQEGGGTTVELRLPLAEGVSGRESRGGEADAERVGEGGKESFASLTPDPSL